MRDLAIAWLFSSRSGCEHQTSCRSSSEARALELNYQHEIRRPVLQAILALLNPHPMSQFRNLAVKAQTVNGCERKVVRLRLSKKNRILKTEVLARAREQHSALTKQVDDFNAVVRAAQAVIDGAVRDYNAKLEELQRFAGAMAEEQAIASTRIDHQSSGGPSAELLEWWINAYRAFRPGPLTVRLPQEIERPDDDLLSHFEELPDAP